jgi:hypothetical protein
VHYLSEYEIEKAVEIYDLDPILGPASKTLYNLMCWTNRNSDGWPYWAKPVRAAAGLIAMLDRPHWEPSTATVAELKAALRPVKAFRTRQGADFTIYGS